MCLPPSSCSVPQLTLVPSRYISEPCHSHPEPYMLSQYSCKVLSPTICLRSWHWSQEPLRSAFKLPSVHQGNDKHFQGTVANGQTGLISNLFLVWFAGLSRDTQGPWKNHSVIDKLHRCWCSHRIRSVCLLVLSWSEVPCYGSQWLLNIRLDSGRPRQDFHNSRLLLFCRWGGDGFEGLFRDALQLWRIGQWRGKVYQDFQGAWLLLPSETEAPCSFFSVRDEKKEQGTSVSQGRLLLVCLQFLFLFQGPSYEIQGLSGSRQGADKQILNYQATQLLVSHLREVRSRGILYSFRVFSKGIVQDTGQDYFHVFLVRFCLHLPCLFQVLSTDKAQPF